MGSLRAIENQFCAVVYTVTLSDLEGETVVGIDAETARKEEEELMLRDANQWLNAGCYVEQPHRQTGAYALHVAAAKGYIKVIKYVYNASQSPVALWLNG